MPFTEEEQHIYDERLEYNIEQYTSLNRRAQRAKEGIESCQHMDSQEIQDILKMEGSYYRYELVKAWVYTEIESLHLSGHRFKHINQGVMTREDAITRLRALQAGYDTIIFGIDMISTITEVELEAHLQAARTEVTAERLIQLLVKNHKSTVVSTETKQIWLLNLKLDIGAALLLVKGLKPSLWNPTGYKETNEKVYIERPGSPQFNHNGIRKRKRVCISLNKHVEVASDSDEDEAGRTDWYNASDNDSDGYEDEETEEEKICAQKEFRWNAMWKSQRAKLVENQSKIQVLRAAL